MAVGPWQILVVVVLLLLLFGASRLSEIGKGLGSGIRNFKQGLEGDDDATDLEASSPKELPEPVASKPAAEAETASAVARDDAPGDRVEADDPSGDDEPQKR